MFLADWVLRAIDAEIGSHPPERGGALLGPRHRPLVTHLVADGDAEVTATTYAPSRRLDARVKALEREAGLELKGIVHSHGAGVDRPTERDALELAEGLRQNGHMARYLAPIVSRGAGAPQAHELQLRAGKISFFAAYRARGGGADVRPLRVTVVPLLRDLERAAEALGAGAPRTFVAELSGAAVLAGSLRLAGGQDLLLLASELYPELPPMALLGGEDGAQEREQLQLAWPMASPPEERLAAALREVVDGPGPHRRAYGPRGGPALTRDPRRARLAGWGPRLAGEELERRAAARRAAVLSRSAGLLSAALCDRTALVAGCGSVGSYLAEQLVRGGVGRITLLDPDTVEAENLSRSAYAVEDLGRPKTEALARRLLGVDPEVDVAVESRALQALEPAGLYALVRGADLVVAATDDPAAQRALDRFAWARGKPALFPGLYAGARGGEVIVSVPERTACFLCATRSRHDAERAGGRVAPEADYGTGRLQGEIALAADIHHVSSAALKLALSLLLPEGTDGALRAFAEDAVAAGTTYLTLSTVPDYWFYPQIFGETAGQGAYQSVWLTPRRSEDCPVCGPPSARVDPLSVPLRAPSRAAFAALLDDDAGGARSGG